MSNLLRRGFIQFNSYNCEPNVLGGALEQLGAWSRTNPKGIAQNHPPLIDISKWSPPFREGKTIDQ